MADYLLVTPTVTLPHDAVRRPFALRRAGWTRAVSASQCAVTRHSGTWSQSSYDEHLALLKAPLDKAGVATQGELVLGRNPPFTPWLLRRNEIWLAVR